MQPIFAYIGPETILPLSSILAAVGGLALMFWGYIRASAVWCLRLVGRNRSSDGPPQS